MDYQSSEEFQRQVRDEANEDYEDMRPTISAYGKTWPAVITPLIETKISFEVKADPSRSIDEQIAETKRKLQAEFPSATVDAWQVNNVGLSPEDKAEHDRLRDEQES